MRRFFMGATTVNAKSVARIVVVGAGAAGLASAWRLALAGHGVTVVDQGVAGRGALWASGGMLAAGFEASAELDPRHELAQPFADLLERSLIDWPGWTERLKPHAVAPLGFRHDGSLTPLYGADDVARADRVQAQAGTLGVRVERWRADEVSQREPSLARSDGALFFPGDGQLDNRAIGLALAAAVFAAGGRLEMGARVTGLYRRAGRVAGIVLAGERVIEADLVVLATGAGRLPGAPGGVETRPVKGQMLAFQVSPGAAPMRVIRSFSIYLALKPGGRLIAGATVEPGVADLETTQDALEHLAAAARRVAPGLASVEPMESWSGLRPAARDAMPMIGEAEPGLIIAGGGYRNGVLLAPIMAETVAALADETAPPLVAAPFHPHRAALTAVRDH
jgi:glycine oxidase